MSYNYQDAPSESQQEYFGKVHTDNKETLYNALKRIEELEEENRRLDKLYTLAKDVVKQFLNDCVITNDVLDKIEPLIKEMKIEY